MHRLMMILKQWEICSLIAFLFAVQRAVSAASSLTRDLLKKGGRHGTNCTKIWWNICWIDRKNSQCRR
ncbi:hypothetical protein KH400_23055, partial [Desertibacillus haloalkaliphilus]|nr:hypothetical protein [Desertibacillus haloalkaliphilus]